MAWVKEVKKMLKIYYLFCKNCLMAQMEYRFNFFVGVIVESGFVLSKLIYIFVIYQSGLIIEGLSRDSILLFSGTFMLVTGVYVSLFVVNFFKISEDYIHEGKLDLYITKPISLQFLTTMRYIDFGLAIPNLIVGSVLLVMGWSRLGIEVSLANIAGYTLFLIGGIVISYTVMLIPHLFSFWFIKTSAVNDLSNDIWEFGHMPARIYGKTIQIIGIYIIPLFLASNFGPLYLLNQLSMVNMMWGILAPLALLLLTRLLWKAAVRNYSSASS
ncbi:ABC transporter permease [Brevibacillus laterosporus]|uniref:ABC transporter permease n=1 Tax=Brevibacillus laterosporus TaxID=1465 RepID=UPI0026536AC7|nr:ABC-2 family transporter protein [Brevibacillus laterosporus]MDN9010663.1 ABC-2 family transporter protein [Brevibacillus laterosporus]MDO0941774.1 ABC-2 family transporter protein [Brevibacillus laterosporus]